MKHYFTLLSLLFGILITYSQDTKSSEIAFGFGRSTHGSGDIKGYHYSFTYNTSIAKKTHWELAFEGTLNDAPDYPLTFEDEAGNTYDATLHTVISGFQIVSGIKYNIVERTSSSFGISLLPLIRYQATSLSDYYETLYPAVTNVPFPVRNIIRYEPARTLALGASVRLNYNYFISKKTYLGVYGAFQTDTNGDSIYSALLKIGRQFNW